MSGAITLELTKNLCFRSQKTQMIWIQIKKSITTWTSDFFLHRIIRYMLCENHSLIF